MKKLVIACNTLRSIFLMKLATDYSEKQPNHLTR